MGQPSGVPARTLDLSTQEITLGFILIFGALLLGFFPLIGLSPL